MPCKDAITVTALVRGLKDSAKPGTSVDVRFRFQLSGDIDMQVPVEACPAQAVTTPEQAR